MAGRLPEDAVAVVGMGCIFPDAGSPQALWESVLAGRRAFRRLPAVRMPVDLYYDPDPAVVDRTYCNLGAFITGWQFDADAFRIPPVTVAAADPTHWLALSVAQQALDDAGLDPAAIDASERARIGVFLGNSLGGDYARSACLGYRWPFVERAFREALAEEEGIDAEAAARLLGRLRQRYLAPLPPITEDSLPGMMANTIAGRICGYFDLGGGGFVTDGACASALIAVAEACDALVAGRLDVALAGGVDLSIDPFELIGFARIGALARDDCRPYDRRADGFLPGEGCGMFVLMRARDARATNRRLRAVIRGWGLSSDGHGGITEPRREGQLRALRAAYRRAGYPLWSVGLVEGHGTGTVRGDQVEISALQAALDGAPESADVGLGSVKSNIGHCKAAAGAAGLIKVILALERRIRPPTAACDQPHPLFDEPLPLAPMRQGAPWSANGSPRRAAASAFGFGGTNAHITLEEADPGALPATGDLALLSSAQSTELILVAAEDRSALATELSRLASAAGELSRAEMTDFAAALAAAGAAGSHRVAVASDAPWHLKDTLEQIAGALAGGRRLQELDDPAAGRFTGVFTAADRPPSWVALFPGQGLQRPSMMRHLASRYPFVNRFLAAADEALSGLNPGGIGRWITDPPGDAEAVARLAATELAQPLVTAASMATWQVLAFHGLKPAATIGYSLGEIGALAAAGAFSPVTAVRVAALRGRAMAAGLAEQPAGAMAAVAAGPAETQALVESFALDLELANLNAPRQTVVSGPRDAVTRFQRRCRAERVACRLLPVGYAFHSRSLEPITETVLEALSDAVTSRAPRGFVSAVTAQPLASHEDVRHYLAGQIRQPVRFEQVVRAAHRQRPAFWVEVGPGNVLGMLVRDILGAGAGPVFATDPAGGDGYDLLIRILGRAWTLGHPIDPARLFAHRFHRDFDLDRPRATLLVNPCERPMPGDSPASAAAPVSEPSAAPALPDADDDDGAADTDEHDRILASIQDWIVSRTGFSPEVVTAELRLRDDLNLDSIKATELIQTLIERWRLPGWPDPGWENATIDELATVAAAALGRTTKPGLAAVLPARLEGLEPGGDWVRRFIVEPRKSPLEREPPVPLAAGSQVLIVGEPGSAAAALAEGLERRGLRPRIDGGGAAGRAAPGEELDVLAWLVPPAAGLDLSLPAATFERRLEGMARRLIDQGRRLARSATGGRSPLWLVLCADPGDPVASVADAPAAVLKSLAAEHTDVRARWIRFPSSFDAERIAKLAVAELTCGGQQVLYRYDEGGRRTSDAAAPAPLAATAPVALGADDVVLVSGGARGITLELALTLARARGVRLALLGRSPPERPEVVRAVRRCAEAGIRCRYWRCDVTDAAVVEATVRAVEDQLGVIAAVLHGAGITRPVAFAELEPAEFVRCVRVKALGLRNLLASLPPKRLRAVHVVSSVAGSTGMARQADYAFANAWLDGAAVEIGRSHPGLNAVSIAYSVWRNIGMGEDLGAVDLLASMGVTSISPEAGAAAYRDLLDTTTAARQVVTGRLTPPSEALLFAPAPAPRPRFLAAPMRWIPRTELVADAIVSHRRDRYLSHHVFRGTPLLPAVIGIDAMVAAAVACDGSAELPAVDAVRLRRPIVVPADAEVSVRVCVLADPSDSGRRYRVALRSSIDEFKQDHFTAVCVFRTPSGRPSPEPLEAPLPERLPVDVADLTSELLFQGPFFRRITALRRFDPGVECLAEITIPKDSGYFAEGVAGGLAVPYPAARDAFLQSLMLLVPGLEGLPVAIRELRILRRCPAGTRVLCRARPAGNRFDIDVFDPRGRLVEVLHGITVAARGDLPEDAGSTSEFALPAATSTV